MPNITTNHAITYTNSLRFSEFLMFDFSHFTTQVKLSIFRREWKPKIFGIENGVQRRIRKIITFLK